MAKNEEMELEDGNGAEPKIKRLRKKKVMMKYWGVPVAVLIFLPLLLFSWQRDVNISIGEGTNFRLHFYLFQISSQFLLNLLFFFEMFSR